MEKFQLQLKFWIHLLPERWLKITSNNYME